MKTSCRLWVLTGLLFFCFTAQALAHCEIPCGIYGDQMRIQMMQEHLMTMGKSMKMVSALRAEKTINHNQLVRWVLNKEKHADQLQKIGTCAVDS